MIKLDEVDSRTLFDFGEDFGRLMFLHETGKPSYKCRKTKKEYNLPDEMTDGELQKIMEKSLADNYDYLFDMVKDNEIKIDYKPGVIYA